MAGENEDYDLLEDVGEEVDYDDYTLEDEDLGDLPEDVIDVTVREDSVAGGEPKHEAAPPAEEPSTKPSTESTQPSSAAPTTSAQKEAAQPAPRGQPGSSKGQQRSEPQKQVPFQKAGVKKPQAQRQGAGPGPGRGRGDQQRGRGSQRGGRLGDRSGRGRENGREQFQPSRPASRHGTPPLAGGMQMPNANMGGLPMPPAMMMSGQGPRPHGPMGGPPRMQGHSMQPGMGHAPPPRPMHQGMERGQQPQPPPMQNQRPREPIRWQQPHGEPQHAPPHPLMDRLHQRQLDAHMGPPRQLHMERQHPHEPAARMLPNSHPALPFPPGMGDLLKQRLDMANAGGPPPNQPRLQMNGKQPSKEGLQMALGMDPLHQMRPGQRPAPRQPGSSLQDRLSAPLGALRAGQWPHGQGGPPAQGPLLRAGESAEALRMKEELLEQQRAAQRKKEAEARRKAEELKAKKAEMARLRIQLQQAENRNIKLAQEAAERERKCREAEEFEAMKLRVLQLEHLVAEKALVDPAAAQQASAALPAAKAAAAAAAPAPALQPQRGSYAALQVDFEEDIDEAEAPAIAVQPKPSRAAKVLPRTVAAAEAVQRPKLKSDVMPEVAKQSERKEGSAKPLSIQERLSVRREQSQERQEQRRAPPDAAAPERKAVTDLRDLLSRNKRSRDREPEEGHLRPSVKSRMSRS